MKDKCSIMESKTFTLVYEGIVYMYIKQSMSIDRKLKQPTAINIWIPHITYAIYHDDTERLIKQTVKRK